MFEEFCFELLKEMGLKNVDWRKGTGYDSSPADSGRDIECQHIRYDTLLGEMIVEKWFVECKHHKQGIAASEFQGALAWAAAERPDRIILIASNFLSNSCKDHLEAYKRNNNPAFSITVWERPRLEKLASSSFYLLNKYKIEYRDSILDCINQYHINYLKAPSFNTLHQLREAMRCLTQQQREKVCDLASLYYIYISFDEETENIYQSNKIVEMVMEKVEIISKTVSEAFAVGSFVNCILSLFLSTGNISKVETVCREQEKFKEFMYTHRLEIAERVVAQHDGTIEKHLESLPDVQKMFSRTPEKISQEISERYDIYTAFCDTVVQYLIKCKGLEIQQ